MFNTYGLVNILLIVNQGAEESNLVSTSIM